MPRPTRVETLRTGVARATRALLDAPFSVGVTAVYLLLRAGSFVNTPVRVTDTPTYETVVAEPLWSIDFWAGQRSFTIPLLWKLIGDDQLRIVVHLVLSIACWLVFAAAVALSIAHPVLRRVAFCLVLAFSVTTEIILWDPLLLSESLSLSLTVLVLAGVLWLIREPSPVRAGALLVVVVLWTFTRDSHAYVLLFAAAVVLVSLLHPAQRRLKLALAVGGIVVFGLSSLSADHGLRWYQPMRDILLNRVDKDAGMRVYFEERLGPLWKDADARRVYVRYLATHPRYALLEPFSGTQTTPFSSTSNAAAVLDPDLRIYNDNANKRVRPLPKAVSDLLYVQGTRSIVLWLLAVCAAAGAVAYRFGASWLWAVPVVAIASTAPHALVAYHLSGLEVDRHALEVAVILRLALLTLALFACDAVLAARRASPAVERPA